MTFGLPVSNTYSYIFLSNFLVEQRGYLGEIAVLSLRYYALYGRLGSVYTMPLAQIRWLPGSARAFDTLASWPLAIAEMNYIFVQKSGSKIQMVCDLNVTQRM